MPSTTEGEVPARFTLPRLGRSFVHALVAIGVLAAIVIVAPGLGEVRGLLRAVDPGWLLLGAALEALSFGSYVVMFGPVFLPGMSWRRSWQIGGSELAVGSIVPTSGVAGLLLGAWVLREGGMRAGRIARRSVAFYLLKSSVNVVAVAVLGTLAFVGVGPKLSPLLTIVPASLALIVILAVIAIPQLGPGTGPAADDGRTRRLVAGARSALVIGTEESLTIMRRRDPRVLVGAVGYWIFDNAVLWATFEAVGISPPLMVVLLAYLLGQLGGLLPIPGGVGGMDAGLIGALVVYGAPAAGTAAAVLTYRVLLFWIPLLLGSLAFFQLRRDMPRPPELAGGPTLSRG